MLLSVMDAEGEADELRSDLACARPCLNYARRCGFLVSYLFEELVVHVWTFFERS
jgi:hypothetical protein